MRIAHRGAPAFIPENTIPSFLKAIELQADYLELDVHQTQDNHLVILHDKSIDRTTNGKGQVSELTLDQIKSFDAGLWFDKKFLNHKIPTLAEVLDLLIQHPNLKAIIEIKGNEKIYPGIAKRVVSVVNEKGLSNRVIYKSFDPEMLTKFQKLSPSTPSLYVFLLSIPRLSVTVNTSVSFHSPLEIKAQYLQEHYYFITEKFVSEAHAKGYKVIAWGVDTEKQMKESFRIGVDGIETDNLDILMRVVP